jgi:hypothetical protein
MPKLSPGWSPGDEPTSELARLIINAWFNDDFILAIIYGTPRIGKSAYALKVMHQVYDYLKGYSALETFRRYMGWEPSEVITQWAALEGPIPCYTWDDAGCWLFTLKWSDPLLVEVQRYFNVIGTDIKCVMLTSPTPEWILSKIGSMPGAYWIKITKRDGGTAHLGALPPSKRWAREATAYYPFKTPDLKSRRVRKRFYDLFSCRLAQDLYDEYGPIRQKYARLVREAMKAEMLNKIKAREEKGKSYGRDLNKEMGAPP